MSFDKLNPERCAQCGLTGYQEDLDNEFKSIDETICQSSAFDGQWFAG